MDNLIIFKTARMRLAMHPSDKPTMVLFPTKFVTTDTPMKDGFHLRPGLGRGVGVVASWMHAPGFRSLFSLAGGDFTCSSQAFLC